MKTSESVLYRGIWSSKKRTCLPLGFHNQYEASCQKEIVFPFSRRSKERYEKRIREKIPDRTRESVGNEIVFSQEEI